MAGLKIGLWAFVIGMVLAIILSIFFATNTPQWAVVTLAVLGIVVGLFNVTDKEVQNFLIASLAFLISFQALSTVFTTLTLGWEAVGAFFRLVTTFIAPAAAIVAVIALFKMAKD
jgi:hypothetical protein